eukprot:g1985.t1
MVRRNRRLACSRISVSLTLLVALLFVITGTSKALQTHITTDKNSSIPSNTWKDAGIRVPDEIRTAMVQGGTKNVNKVVDYSVDQAASTIEKSSSASAVDEASSRMDAVVAQALDTSEEAQHRIEREIEELTTDQETAERRNQEETLRSPVAPKDDKVFGEKMKTELAGFDADVTTAEEYLNISRVDLTEKGQEHREKIAKELADRLAKWSSDDTIGVAERKIEEEIENEQKETFAAKGELEEHSKALAGHAKTIERFNSDVVPSLRGELRSAALGRADDGLFMDEAGGDAMEKDFPNYQDLVAHGEYGGRDFEGSDDEKNKKAKSDVSSTAFVELETPPLSTDDMKHMQNYFDNVAKNVDIEKFSFDSTFDPFDDQSFFTEATGGATGGATGWEGPDLDFYGLTGGATGGATGGEFEAIEDATGSAKPDFVFPKSGITRTTVWDLLQSKRYREAVAMAATEASATHSAETKFREHAMRLRKMTERAKETAEDLDERVEGLQPVYKDAAKFSIQVAKALDDARERVDRYSRVEKLPLRGRVRFEYDEELKVAKIALDQAISNAIVAKEKRDTAKRALDKVTKARDAAWERARSLAEEGRAAHHHLIQLKVKASEADSTYAEARKDFYEKEVSTGREHLHQLAGEAATVLGPVMDINLGSAGLSSFVDGDDDVATEIDIAASIPAPIGKWSVEPSFVTKIAKANLPLPTPVALVAHAEDFDAKTATDAGLVAAVKAERESVTFLRLETVRQAYMQNQLYKKSHAVHRAQVAEEMSSKSTPEDPTDEQLAVLGKVGLMTEKAVSAFDKQEEMLSEENKVVHVLQSLENQKLRLRHDEAALEHASDVYEKSRSKLSEERQVSMNLVREAVVSEDETDDFVMPPEILPVYAGEETRKGETETEEKKAPDDERDLLSDVLDVLRPGRGAPTVPSFVEIDETARGNDEKEEKKDAFRAFVEPANPTNGRSLKKGNMLDLVLPDLNFVDPDESSDVATKMAQHARVVAEDSAEDAAAAAKLVDTARAGYNRVRVASESSANAFAVADAKARVAEEAMGNIEGGATGIAWRAMGYPGQAPSAWMRGNPYKKSTTKLLYDVLEMGPIDLGVDSATGADSDEKKSSLEDEIGDTFGIYGPTGAEADAFVDAIKSARQQHEIRQVDSRIYRDEAEQIREENDI